MKDIQLTHQQMNKKLFTEKQVDISAILAGPIPPGLLIFQNYKVLGKEKQAYIALASTLIFTVLFFYGLFQIPQDILNRIPGFFFTAFYGVLVFLFFRYFLAKEVNEAFESGAKKYSNWSVAGVTLIGLVINLALILGLAIDQPLYDGEVRGVNGNELYFNQSVPEEEVDKLAEILLFTDFFGKDYENVVRMQLLNDEYLFTIMVDEGLWSDREIIVYFNSMKELLEIEFGKPVQLKLESVSLAGTSKFMEI